MIRLILFNLLFLIPGAVSAQEPESEILPKTVITAEEIRSAGITRLHELFTLFDNWTGYTINGQDWIAAPFGLSSYQNSDWIVIIDNHPSNVSVVGLNSFNMLPVSLQEIEKIIVIDTPQLYNGTYTDRGLIHIITDNERTGWITDLRFSVGNEINDPGPFEFTELNSPNEERLGPDADMVFGYRSDKWHVKGSGSVMRHRSTDTPVERRIFEMLRTEYRFEDPTNLKVSGHIRGGYTDKSLELNIQGGAVSYRDFLFFRPYGREIPIQFQNRYTGLDAFYNFSEALSLTLNSTVNLQEPGFSPNRENFNFDFRQVNWSHGLEMQWGDPKRRLLTGLRLEQAKASGSFEISPDPVEIWTFYHQWNEQITERSGISASLRIAADGNEYAFSTGLFADWEIMGQQSLKPYFSFSERLASQTQDLWFWVDKGYTGINQLDIEHEPVPQRRTSTLTSAGVLWELSPAENIVVNIHPNIHHHKGYYISRQQYTMARPQQWFTHNGIDFFPDERITLAGLNADLSLQSFETVNHTIFFGHRFITGGTEELKNAFDEIPARRFRFTTTYKPVAGFELWASVQAQSAVIWREFEGIDGEAFTDLRQLDEGIYHNKTGPITHVDLGGRKALWDERLWLSLFVKNLLNRPYFHYPAGADNDLTFFMQLEVRL